MSDTKETTETESHSIISLVRKRKIKVTHGTYIEEPKCKICDTNISHEWLGGDYSLLMCDKKECWDELNARHKHP